jgi:hypothetical protein
MIPGGKEIKKFRKGKPLITLSEKDWLWIA